MEVKHLAVDVSKYQGEFTPEAAWARGFSVVIGRCNIGYAPRDVRYLENKAKVEALGIPWLAYCVNWPINRQPEREALTGARLITSDELPLPPAFVIADIELGVNEHKAGHHTISGDELYAINKKYVITLANAVDPIPVVIYTAKWYWNDVKLYQWIDGYEKEFMLWHAYYPFGNMPSDATSPFDIDPEIAIPFAEPWDRSDLFGWQWTSKGQGAKYGISESKSIDQNVLFTTLVPAPPAPPPDDPLVSYEARIWNLEKTFDEIGEIIEKRR